MAPTSDGLQIADLLRIAWLSDCVMAPDGLTTAAVETRLDVERDAVVRRIVVSSPSGMRRIEGAGLVDTGPRFSPTGSWLAFVSDRDGAARPWVIGVAGGAPRRIADVAGCWGAPAWSPDGSRLAVVAEEHDAAAARTPVVEVPEIPFKVDGASGVARARRSALWVTTPGGGTPRRLGLDGVVVSGGPSWSPDGETIALLGRRVDRGFVADGADLWAIDVGSGEVRRVTDGAGPVVAFAWSPAGHALAYIGHRRGEAEGVDRDVWVVPVAGGSVTCLTGRLPRSAGTIVRSDDERGEGEVRIAWSQIGDRIYFPCADGGRGQLAWVDPSGRFEIVVSGDRACLSFALAASGASIAFIASSPASPGEIHVCDADGRGERRASAVNDELLAARQLAGVEPIVAVADDGQAIDGWITRPLGHGGPIPLVLDVHGGPHQSVGWRFCFAHQRLAARGLASLTGNPRGSQGYGERFATAVLGDWGGRDLHDLMTLLDAGIAEAPADPDRLAITGVSYGGYVVEWAISQTGRFRAAVAENGISDLLALWAHGVDGGGFITTEMGGPPWERPERYVERSPLAHAHRIQTPLLLLHGEADQDCPIIQSEQLFVALRRLGRPVTFVRVPGEGHLMVVRGRPSVRVRRAEMIDGWFAALLEEEVSR